EPARTVGRQATENLLRCDERWRRLLCRQPSGAGRERQQQSEEKKSSIAHEPPLRSNCGIESAQGSEIAKQIVKIAVVEPVRSEDRHRRLRVVLHRFHLVLLVSLNPLARIHDLDREEVFVFLDAPDRLPGRWCQRYRLVSGAEASAARGLDGVSVPGTPSLIGWNRPASVRPEAHSCVMSGARTPRASIPWQSAQRAR